MSSPISISVPFHGTNLLIIHQDGEPYAAMKPIVEGMGMAWQSQHEKLKQRFAPSITEIVTEAKGGVARTLKTLIGEFVPRDILPELIKVGLNRLV